MASLRQGLLSEDLDEDLKLDLRSRNETGSTLTWQCLDEDAEGSTTDGTADDIGRCDDDLVESCASPLSVAGAEPLIEPKLMSLDEQELPAPARRDSLMLGTLIFFCVLCGCACQAPYELLNSQDKGCAHLISLAEHLFGLLVTCRVAFRRRQLPLSGHLVMAAGSIGHTQLQNAALGTKLPTLVLITIKNGNLAANIFLGKMVLNRQYGLQQLAAVLLLSFGLLLLSVVGATPNDDSAGEHNLWSCVLGIVLLAGALLSRAAGALAQEHWSKTGAIPVEELLFYRSLLGLPAVLMHAWPVAAHGARWLSGAHEFSWPGPWALLALNTVMDYGNRFCITHLIERTSALTANMILTFQRFISFVLSAAFFAAEVPGRWHWLGAIAVLAGTLFYAAAPAPAIVPSPKERRD